MLLKLVVFVVLLLLGYADAREILFKLTALEIDRVGVQLRRVGRDVRYPALR